MTDCDGGHCITCGDDGVPMTVLRVDVARGLALWTLEGDGCGREELAMGLYRFAEHVQ